MSTKTNIAMKCTKCDDLRAELQIVKGLRLADTVIFNAEMERVQKQFGTCSVCGYCAWKNTDEATEACQFCRLRAELERVQKQCAAKDYALKCANGWFAELGWSAEGDNRTLIRRALDPL